MIKKAFLKSKGLGVKIQKKKKKTFTPKASGRTIGFISPEGARRTERAVGVKKSVYKGISPLPKGFARKVEPPPPPTDNDLWEGQTLPGPMTGKVPAIGAVVEN